MGYYSTMRIEVKVKPGRRAEFLDILEKRRDGKSDLEYRFISNLGMIEDGSLYSDNSNGKHYQSEEFAFFLAPFVEEGEMDFTGEDGEKWGYHFNGNGKVFFVEWERVVCGELTAEEAGEEVTS